MRKLLFAIILGLLAVACSQSGSSDQRTQDSATTGQAAKKPGRKMGHLSVKQFEQIRQAGVSTIVIDVRTPKEIADGKIPGSMEIDYEGKEFEEKIGVLERERSYIVYCRTGKRSSKAADYMLQNGFKNVFILDGGYEAWEKQAAK